MAVRDSLNNTNSWQTQLRDQLESAPNQLRPIITSLNGDNSWLWSFPRPPAERASSGKVYYHVVFEPWLNGPTSQFSSWVIHLQLSSPPAAANADDVIAIARRIEAVAADVLGTPRRAVDEKDLGIDAILLGFHYLDHVHEPTLRTFDKRIPVIATPEAAAIVEPWGHFDTIRRISNFTADASTWRDTALHPGAPLPSWITPIRLLGHHELNYCTVLIWTHEDDSGSEIHEAIIQSPHGVRLDSGPFSSSLQAFLDSSPPTERLALFHGLKESHAVGMKNTYGAENGLALWRSIGGAKYWIPSHHSELWYSGLLMRALWVYDTPRTLEWALGRELSKDGKLDDPNLVEVKNGESFVLS